MYGKGRKSCGYLFGNGLVLKNKGGRNLKFTELNKNSKKILFATLSASILATTITPTISTFAASSGVDEGAIQGVLHFSDEEVVTKEHILDTLSKEMPEINLSGSIISEELDNYGNLKFVIETEKQEIDYFNEVTLDDIEMAFLLDPGVESQRTGNILSYILMDGTYGEMIETFDDLDRRVITVTEANKTNEIIFDSVNEELKLDGNVVTSEENHVIVIQQDESEIGQRNAWTFLASGNRTTNLQTAVRNASVSIFVTLVSAMLPARTSIQVAIAQTVINFYRDINSSSSLVYSTFRQYFRPLNEHRFVDRFYGRPTRLARDFITTRSVIENWHH